MIEPLGNLLRLRRLLDESPFDALVAVSPENVTFTSGIVIASQKWARDRLALVVWPKSGEPAFIVCNIEEPQTRRDCWIQDIRPYVEFTQSPIEMLAATLNEMGLGEGRIGIEKNYLTAHYWDELQERMPRARMEGCDAILAGARAVKTEAEVERLGRAARLTEKSLLAVFATIAEGETEKSMFDRIASNLLLVGGDSLSHVYVNAGPNTGFPHCDPSRYEARRGDIVNADIGIYFGNYLSDIARTGVVGAPSEEQRSVYSRLLEVHLECIDAVRPGRLASDEYGVMKNGLARVGIPFSLPHGGHGIGLILHEHPTLDPRNGAEFEPGVVVCVETRVRWPGQVGYRIEDLVLCTDGAPRILTGFFDNSRLFEI